VQPNKVDPQSVDVEASLLGSLLIDPDAIVKIADSIAPIDFYDDRHRVIYEACLRLYEQQSPIDVITLSEELKVDGSLKEVGGASYITQLTNTVPTATHVEQYAAIVSTKSIRRRLIAVSTEIAQIGYDEKRTIAELVEEAESKLFDVSQRHVKNDIMSMEEVLADSFERLDALHKDKGSIRGTPSGYKDMDAMLAGFQKSDLLILAARPAMGKAQPLDANILLSNGTWKKMGSIEQGDQLTSIDGKPSKVIGVFPQGKKSIYTVSFSDGRSAEFCDEHLWSVTYRDWTEPRILTTSKIMDMLTRKRYQGRLWIDRINGKFGTERNHTISPWAMGALLGEGDFSSLRFSSADDFMTEKLTKELGSEFKLTKAGKYDYRIIQSANHRRPGKVGVWPNNIREELKKLGLWEKHGLEKFVPEVYKSGDYASRLSILQGLLDSDGWVEKHGSVRFSSSSKQLAHDVLDIARSIGACATVKEKYPTYTYKGVKKDGALSYVINITHAIPGELFSLPRKIARTKSFTREKRLTFDSIIKTRTAEAQCIKVSHPSELYVTDDFVVTHNTALALNLAQNVAVESGLSVLYFSMEMSKEQLVDRLLASEADVNSWNLRTGNLSDNDFEKISHAMGVLSEAKLYIDDTPGITVSELRTKARRQAHKQEIGLLVVDYLQLMSGGSRFSGSDNRVQEISEISRGLKGIARELNIPVLALSQLSRSVESRSPQIPQLSDLRESGSIEQDADVVAFIYREDYYNPEESTRPNIMDVLVKKHRNGATGKIELYFDRERQKIKSLDTKHTSQFDS
jgi:replicative DNA helicase